MKINLKELKSNIFQLILLALVCLILVGSIALLISTGKSIKISDLGSFGDFFGGVLNPIFSLLAFLALLTTIILQASELKSTRKELKKSAKAQQEQSESLKLQNEATKLQIFENTFFSLLSEVNSLLDDFLMENKEKKIDENIEKSIKSEIIHSKDKLKEEFSNINNGLMKTYFIMLYQLLKYVDNNNIENKKFYKNIVRANLDNKILALLAINCYVYDFKEYKSFLDKYSFFEHLDISSDQLFPIFFILKDFFTDFKIYGDNENIKKQFSSTI